MVSYLIYVGNKKKVFAKLLGKYILFTIEVGVNELSNAKMALAPLHLDISKSYLSTDFAINPDDLKNAFKAINKVHVTFQSG